MDIVYIRELEVKTIIGIYDWEREQKQVVSINLEMASDIRKSADSDSIEHTLDYKAVAKRLIDFVESSQFFLVETLAEKIAEIKFKEQKHSNASYAKKISKSAHGGGLDFNGSIKN